MQGKTGKPARKKRTAEEKARDERADRIKLAELGPIDENRKYSVEEARVLEKTSTPIIYRDLRSGALESWVENGRRWISGRSLARRQLPPDKRPKPLKASKFKPIKSTPNARAAFQAVGGEKAHAEA